MYRGSRGRTFVWDMGSPLCFNAFQECVFLFRIFFGLGENPKLFVSAFNKVFLMKY